MLYPIISSTWELNSILLANIFRWWDVYTFYRDEGYIDSTVDERIYDRLTGEVAWVALLIGV